ncbi:hypothetical protein FHX41_0341 [Actinomadura hallensis]|uniref:PT repeat-containing protein n=1 Tax=Actinomadura hallensis TaxID=337895 RepID=A0A543I885_9ACTN|nr:hypothetical protein [Actinomadura hallensis]TQM66755.1 hypothetical protein FHX41_0341 [Actinomadura hallensis]HLV75602.1 hypothetical protein [Vulgatibacteraceae bacterium]
MNGRHLAALLLVPALALTACGGDGGDPEPAASEQTLSQTPSAAPSGASGDDRDGAPGGGGGATPALPSAVPSKVVNAFVACMREQGVKVPEDVGNWRPDPQDGRTQKALMACIGRSGAPNPPSS